MKPKLTVIRRPKCRGWYIRPTEGGRTKWVYLSDKKTEADRLVLDYERQRELKKSQGFNSQADIDLALEKYLLHKNSTTLTTRKSRKKYANAIRFFQSFLRHRPISAVAEITRDIVVEFFNYRVQEQGISDASWNTDRNILVNFFNYCLENKWIRENPISGSRLPKKKLTDYVPEHLDEYQIRILLEHIKKQTNIRLPYYQLFATLAYTGMRLGEALTLTKKDVLLEQRLLWIREKIIYDEQWKKKEIWRPKTKRNRYVPLPDELLPVIKERLDCSTSELLFPNSKNKFMKQRQIYDALVNFCRRAGLPRVHIHSLRHSFTSIATVKGYSERLIQEVLGHTTPSMTRRYTHLRPEFLGEKFKGLRYGQE